MSKYAVFSGPYFPVFGLNTENYSVFSPNTGKYEPEETPYLDIFHTETFFDNFYLCINDYGFYERSVIHLVTLHKKLSFPLRISSVNVTKSAGNCEFGHIC